MAITLDGSSGVTSSNKIETQTGFRQLNGTTQTAGIFPERVITGAGTSDDLCIFTETGYDLHVMTGGTVDKKLSVDSAGRVTMPYQPYAWISTDAHTTGILTGGTRVIDNASMYNTSNGRFTIPVNGHYAVYYNLYCGATGQQELQLRVNGTNVRQFNNIMSQPAYTGSSGHTIIYVYAGDYVEFNNNKGDVRSTTIEGYGLYLIG